ncbi:enoyl-CoA hydratase/isomerase family protein [uncultured Anaerococcus sp.]|uniref:enoyl-CoA hydratase/isomerase family protein n=1 Tax=uncultured Anaerococcus sp. TaxID=293428 RepID=UPI00262C5693|nr:enoyl-CoA hydratase/isomerase family protein [uncultured Anaerococcus sp.]
MIKEKIIENVGVIYLDRPKLINALNYEMISELKDILSKWEVDDRIRAVLFDSLSDRGFCAGGDLKEIYSDITDNNGKDKAGFFKKEFELDKYISSYKKPIISHWYGITMGGGIGLSINSDIIIADETVNWAMPETSLGFVPDVGVGKFISTLPQSLGQYVGLCGVSLSTSDLIKYNLADIYIHSKDYQDLIEKLFDLSRNYEGEELLKEFKNIARNFERKSEETDIDKNIDKINKYFSSSSIEEIYDGLKEASDDEFSLEALDTLKERDPFMLSLQFEKYFVCKDLDYKETVDLDLKIIEYAIKKQSMNEGIRAKIIDKDNNPNWPCKTLDEVSDDEVKSLLSMDKTY